MARGVIVSPFKNENRDSAAGGPLSLSFPIEARFAVGHQPESHVLAAGTRPMSPQSAGGSRDHLSFRTVGDCEKLRILSRVEVPTAAILRQGVSPLSGGT